MNGIPTVLYFRRTRHFLNDNEKRLYRYLQEQYGAKAVVGFQIRLADLVFLDRRRYEHLTKEARKAFDTIARMSVDFALFTPDLTGVIVAIELDGSVHCDNPWRERLDHLKDQIFETAQVPFERIRICDDKLTDDVLKKAKAKIDVYFSVSVKV